MEGKRNKTTRFVRYYIDIRIYEDRKMANRRWNELPLRNNNQQKQNQKRKGQGKVTKRQHVQSRNDGGTDAKRGNRFPR